MKRTTQALTLAATVATTAFGLSGSEIARPVAKSDDQIGVISRCNESNLSCPVEEFYNKWHGLKPPKMGNIPHSSFSSYGHMHNHSGTHSHSLGPHSHRNPPLTTDEKRFLREWLLPKLPAGYCRTEIGNAVRCERA